MNQNTNGFESHQVIFDFILNNKTGTLHFQPHGRKLYFDNGNLIFANSEHPAEHFSSILVEMEVLDAETLSTIRQELGESKSLGKHLKEEGIATPKQLAQSLKRQITKIIEAVIADPNAVCDSQENAVPSKLPKLKIQTLALVLQAVSHLPDQEAMIADLPLEQTIVPTTLFQSRRGDLGFPEAYLDFFDYIIQNATTASQLGKEFRWGQRLTDSTLYVLHLLGMIEFQPGDALEEPLHPITIEDEPFHEGADDDDLLADVLPEDQAGPSMDLGEPEPEEDLGEPEPDNFDGSSTAPHEIEIGADTNPTLDKDFAGFGVAGGGNQVLDETLSEPIQPGLFEESLAGPEVPEPFNESVADNEEPEPFNEPVADPEEPGLFSEPEPMGADFGEPEPTASDDLDETAVEMGGPTGFAEEMQTLDPSLSDPDDLGKVDFNDLAEPSAEEEGGFEITPEDSGSNWSENSAVGFGGFSDDTGEPESDFGSLSPEAPEVEAMPVDFGGFPEDPPEESGFGELPSEEDSPFGEPSFQEPGFTEEDSLPEDLALDEDNALLTDDVPDFDVEDLGDEHGLVEEDEPAFDDVSLDDAFEKSLAEASGLSADDFQDLQPDFDPGQTTFDAADPSDFSEAETVDDPITAFDSDAQPPTAQPVSDEAAFRSIDDDSVPDAGRGVVMPDPEEDPHEQGAARKKSRLPVFALIAIFLAAILGGAYYFMFMRADPFAALDDPYAAMNANEDNTPSPADTSTPGETTDGEAMPESDSTEPEPLAETQSSPSGDEDAAEAGQPEPEPSSSAATVSTAKDIPVETPQKDPSKQTSSKPDVAVEPPVKTKPQQAPIQDDAPLSVEGLTIMTQDTLSAFKEQKSNFSLVVVVACSPATVRNILNSSDGEDILVFPRYLDGRTCYMVTWGLFDNLQEANESKSRLPQQFQSSNDPSWVVNLKKYR